MSVKAPQAIVIGASAGGVDALSRLLVDLPKDYPLPILVVVHLPPERDSVLPQLLQAKCALCVHEAEDKETLEAGHVYFAPPDYHLMVEKEHYLSLSSEEAVMFSRPSIDVLFETAADAFGETLIGIILTGANSDGAHGLKMVCKAGGIALVQNPEMAYAKAMPSAALEACPEARVMDLDSMVDYFKRDYSC